MRIVALAFGILAGLIASLILALGGLDVSAAVATPADRQVALIRFGLFVIANLGVLGAGLVLASPLAGAVVMLVGAAGWVGASLLFHHTTDLALVTPPVLLLIAAIIAIIAHFRRPHGRDAEFSRDGRDFAAPSRTRSEDFDELPPTPVSAGFLGSGAGVAYRAEPERQSQQPARGFDDRAQIRDLPDDEEWEPRRRRQPPPRQKLNFRAPDDDEDESAFSGFARSSSGILSFGLYACLAGAALLIFWNLHNGEAAHPAAAKVEASSAVSSIAVSPPAAARAQLRLQPNTPAAPELPSSSAGVVPTVPMLAAASSAEAIAPGPPPLASPGEFQDMAGVVVADPGAAPVTSDSAAVAPQQVTSADAASEPADTDQASAAAPDAGSTGSTVAPVMPYPMPPAIAAGRGRRAPAAEPPSASADTGL